MNKGRTYQVREVARIAGVSVRTLHHYDEIGLLKPSSRTEKGYRLYRDQDLLRTQQILIGRELGLSLEEIQRSVDDPDFDHRAALEKQRQELLERAERTKAMLRAVDEALRALTKGGEEKMNQEELKALFEGFDPSKYEDEVQGRWGNTDAYRESARRTSQYTRDDWQRPGAHGLLDHGHCPPGRKLRFLPLV